MFLSILEGKHRSIQIVFLVYKRLEHGTEGGQSGIHRKSSNQPLGMPEICLLNMAVKVGVKIVITMVTHGLNCMS